MNRILAIVLLLYCSVVFSADPPNVDSSADSLVALLLDAEAVEHRKARQVHFVKTGQELVLVFFTIEGFGGGNNYTFYLAVFEPEWKFDPRKGEAQNQTAENIAKYRLVGYSPVGGKAWRFVDFTKFKVDKQLIALRTKEYASNDPMCCPSIAGTATYKVDSKQFVEVKPN